jgi:hypothetical protein
MFDMTVLDILRVYEEIQRAGYLPEAEDALACWRHEATYEPAWYMDLSASIRQELKAVNDTLSERTH